MEEIAAKTIVTRTKNSGWFGTAYNMNIYRGCSHGCIYCDSRSACYGISGFDQVKGKRNALEIIRNDLRRKVKPGVVGTGAMSDPYNPLEEAHQLTRHALELLSAFSFGVAIATKSDLVVRDLDILQEIREHSPVLVKITVTTTDDHLCSKIEPHAPTASRRLKAVEALASAGIFTGILLMPVLPFLTDSKENILDVVRRAADSGASFIYPALGMTQRQNQQEYYLQKLDELFPGVGRKHLARYGTRYQCTIPQVRERWSQFTGECNRLGLLYRMPDIINGYKAGYQDTQLSFWRHDAADNSRQRDAAPDSRA